MGWREGKVSGGLGKKTKRKNLTRNIKENLNKPWKFKKRLKIWNIKQKNVRISIKTVIIVDNNKILKKALLIFKEPGKWKNCWKKSEN